MACCIPVLLAPGFFGRYSRPAKPLKEDSRLFESLVGLHEQTEMSLLQTSHWLCFGFVATALVSAISYLATAKTAKSPIHKRGQNPGWKWRACKASTTVKHAKSGQESCDGLDITGLMTIGSVVQEISIVLHL
jgi:hypothetical protein